MNHSIGVLYIAIGVYHRLFDDFYRGAEAMLFPGQRKTYFVFTDSPATIHSKFPHGLPQNLITVEVSKAPWPWPTLGRFAWILSIRDRLANLDNLFFFNGNCRFVSSIDDPILLDASLIACKHPGFHDKPNIYYTYDRNPASTAYFPMGQGRAYVAGGFQGGRAERFLHGYDKCQKMLTTDLSRGGYVALWHDESYWNRHIEDSSDAHLVDCGYLYPEGWRLPFTPKILLVDKTRLPGFENIKTGTSV